MAKRSLVEKIEQATDLIIHIGCLEQTTAAATASTTAAAAAAAATTTAAAAAAAAAAAVAATAATAVCYLGVVVVSAVDQLIIASGGLKGGVDICHVRLAVWVGRGVVVLFSKQPKKHARLVRKGRDVAFLVVNIGQLDTGVSRAPRSVRHPIRRMGRYHGAVYEPL
jgi:hypothetical protein